MIQITPQMRIMVAIEPVDFRLGIDGLCRTCKQQLGDDPFSGAVFVFRSRDKRALKVLVYDGQGFWLCHKRLSQAKFQHWPRSVQDARTHQMFAHQLQALLAGGDPEAMHAVPQWRAVTSCKAA